MTRDFAEEPIVGADGLAQPSFDPRNITRERDQPDVVDETCHVGTLASAGGRAASDDVLEKSVERR
jgi:hypothetical protein